MMSEHENTNRRFNPEAICRHLRCKEMFAQGDNREFPREQLYDHFDATAYWCSKTQTGRGPDGEPVRLAPCSLGSGRPCFLSLVSIA